jgi:4-hydroxybenzoate polyprenyltransferase
MEKKQIALWQITWYFVGVLMLGLAVITRVEWLFIVGGVLSLSRFIYQMYLDRQEGDTVSFRRRQVILVIALIAGMIAYWYCSR